MNVDNCALIAAYIPAWARAANNSDDRGRSAARAGRAAMLLLDIAGSTRIVDVFAQMGPRGAEKLSDLLNDCFAELVEVVAYHGGDIVSFTGDGFLALWEASEPRRATLVAAQCALALNASMSDWAQRRASSLRPRILVDTGDVHYCRFGGHQDEWRYFVAGDPIRNVGAAYRSAPVGEVFLCDGAATIAGSACDGEPKDSGLRLVRLRSEPERCRLPEQKPLLNEDRFPIPDVVLDRSQVGGSGWLAEIRFVSTLIINLTAGLFNQRLLDDLQVGFLSIQRVIHSLEGLILDVLMDDKGLCVVAAFGIPPLAHEEDPLRAVQAAVRISEDLAKVSITPSTGVASGMAFCGEIGGRTRRGYTVFGSPLNFAARLMALADGGVLCDSATTEAAQRRVAFAAMPSQRVKGFESPVPIYRPIRVLTASEALFAGETIGRERERAAMRAALDDFELGAGGLVIVQGAPGIGKSRLLADFAEVVRDRGIPHIRGQALAVERSTPYFAWRSVVTALLRVDRADERMDSRSAPLERLSHDPILAAWLPLLGDVLPFDLAETTLTARITGAARAASIEALVVALLERFANRPPVLLFEDLHWLDGASWALLQGALRRLPTLLVVASRRSSNTPHAETTEPYRFTTIEVGSLSMTDTAELVRKRLRTTRAPDKLVSFVHERARGNPLHSEELLFALEGTSNISVDRNGAVTGVERLAEIDMALPVSLEGAIIARIDSLRTDEQLLLKCASAIGEPFDEDLLREVLWRSLSISNFGPLLDGLVERDFFVRRRDGAVWRYEFRHAINEEVTYRLLSFAQRRQLHASIAQAIEERHTGRLEAYSVQLARHWEQAENNARAVDCLEQATERALRAYANRDAIRFIRRALQLLPKGEGVERDARLSSWEAMLGDAHSELAEYDQASAHYERALALVGRRKTRDVRDRALGLVKNAVWQVTLRLFRQSPSRRSHEKRKTDERVAHICERLAERHFFRNEPVSVLDETLAALNHAERCGAVVEMMSGYSALALGLAMSGMRAGALSYRNRALRLAEQVGPSSGSARAYLLAAVMGYGTGEWEFTERCAERAFSLYRMLGDRARAHAPLTVSLFCAILQSDLARADCLLRELDDATAQESTGQGKAWALAARVLISRIRGAVNADELARLSVEARADLPRADRLLCLGVAASGYVQLGDIREALRVADDGAEVLKTTGTVWGSYVYGVSGILEALLTPLETELTSGRAREESFAKARKVCALASRATCASPVCRPQSLLMQGRLALLSNRSRRAGRLWENAARYGGRLHMPREVALAQYELGRARGSVGQDVERLARAAQILEHVGANADLAAVRQAMAGTG